MFNLIRAKFTRQEWSWAFYDWANSAFSTTVMAGFFPIFFKNYWSAGTPIGETTFKLGFANSLASLLMALSAPCLGAVADQGHTKKKFLVQFAVFGAVCTFSLCFVGQGDWIFATLFYVFAVVGFYGSLIFYDSLLVDITPPSRAHRVSALGFSLGYLGGGILFAVNVAMTLKPELFGISDKAAAVRFSFALVGAWWMVFLVPLLKNVQEKSAFKRTRGIRVVVAAFLQLKNTFLKIKDHKNIFLFLLAYWFYIDGVDTIIVMAVDYGLNLGFRPESLIVALLITQFVGFPSALVFGRLGTRYGAKSGIIFAILFYMLITVWGYFMDQEWEFFALAVSVGLVQGGIQALSRSLFSTLIPTDQSAEFFGFYNMMSKSAAVLGPISMGLLTHLLNDVRLPILSVLVLLGIGMAFLLRVSTKPTPAHRS